MRYIAFTVNRNGSANYVPRIVQPIPIIVFRSDDSAVALLLYVWTTAAAVTEINSFNRAINLLLVGRRVEGNIRIKLNF